MGRIFRQLTITDRRKIEKMYLRGEKAKDMADTLRVNVSTIYRELKREDTCTGILTGQRQKGTVQT